MNFNSKFKTSRPSSYNEMHMKLNKQNQGLVYL